MQNPGFPEMKAGKKDVWRFRRLRAHRTLGVHMFSRHTVYMYLGMHENLDAQCGGWYSFMHRALRLQSMSE